MLDRMIPWLLRARRLGTGTIDRLQQVYILLMMMLGDDADEANYS